MKIRHSAKIFLMCILGLSTFSLWASKPDQISESEQLFDRVKQIEIRDQEQQDPYDIALYHGQFSDTDLRNILLEANTDYKQSFITVATLSRPLHEELFGLAMEGEGQLVYHTGMQNHLEYNGLFVLRTENLFRSVPLNIAFGEGLSFATRNPGLENRRKSALNPNVESEYSRNLLNYLMFEMEVALPLDSYNPRAFVRVHHRSGIYGIMCPPTCGSNFVAYGMKFSY